MKKSLLLILACFFAVFMLAGCDDSSDDNTPPAPTTDPLPDIQSLKGTYNIEFFYTDGGGHAVVTTDCDNVTKYVGNDAKQCDKKYGNVEYTGKMTLDVLDNGVKIISKIQMSGGGIDALGGAAISTGDNYQYTEYSTIPNGAISTYIINDTATNNAVTGVTGRNRISKTSDETATYTFTYDKANNILINNMINTKKIPGIGDVKANVVIRLKLDTQEVETLNPNEKFLTPQIGDLKELDSNNDSETSTYSNLIGKYNIDAFSLMGTDSTDSLQASDYANINSDNGNLYLSLSLMGALKIFVLSEDPEKLIKAGLKADYSSENTKVMFELPNLAKIDMTRNQKYTTAQGVGEKQENISVAVNDGKSITKTTNSFDIDITHIGGGNKYYNFSYYADMGSDLGLPAGSYVGVDMGSGSGIDEITFTTKSCQTTDKTTKCTIEVNITESQDLLDKGLVPFIVVAEETTDDTGSNTTGVQALGLLNIDMKAQ